MSTAERKRILDDMMILARCYNMPSLMDRGMMMITINGKKCTKCGTCAAVCPAKVIELSGGPAEFVHRKSCIRCWHCVAACPADAVTCDEFPLSAFSLIGNAEFPKNKEMRNLLMARRSIREFKSKPVAKGVIEELLESASQAPSGHNAQGVEITVITNRKKIDELDGRVMKFFERVVGLVDNHVGGTILKSMKGEKMVEMLLTHKEDLKRYRQMDGEGRLHVFRGAPVLMLAHSGPAALSGKDDGVIALANVMFDAMTRGLGATWIGYVVGAAMVDPTLKKPLGIPMTNSLHAAIILGWPKYKYRRFIPRKAMPVKWVD